MGNHIQDSAIEAALKQEWESAIILNLTFLSNHPTDIPALNRLAKAYKEAGKIPESIGTYNQVIAQDKYNVIAKKNLAVLIKNPPLSGKRQNNCQMNTEFIKEPGKSKTFPLTRLGDANVISNLLPGQIVYLTPKKHTIFVYTASNEHVGALTDDIAFQIKQCLSKGIHFEAVIKSASNQKVIVFLRELTNGQNSTLNFLI